MPEDEKKKPVVAQAAPVEDSHGERPTKCAFCDKPAVTVVKGYPVCQEHADMLYKETERGAPSLKKGPEIKDQL